MRGQLHAEIELFHTFHVEDRIRLDHPLRDIKKRVDAILDTLSPRFDEAYSEVGRPSVPPERLLKAILLMMLYSIRSERQLCERIDTDLLFRWFLDLSPSDEAFDATTFSHNRKRLDRHQLTRGFFDAVLAQALMRDLCSEHFSVDGTLIESYASAKSFQPVEPPAAVDASKTPAAVDESKGSEQSAPQVEAPVDPSKSDPSGRRIDRNGFKPRNLEVDFHGQKRTNATHRIWLPPRLAERRV